MHSNVLADDENSPLREKLMFLGLPAPLFTIDMAGLPREAFQRFFELMEAVMPVIHKLPRPQVSDDSEPDEFIPQLMELHLQGRFPFDRLVTTYPLADINRAVQEQHAGLCIKPVLLT